MTDGGATAAKKPTSKFKPVVPEYVDIPERGISAEICKNYKYGVICGRWSNTAKRFVEDEDGDEHHVLTISDASGVIGQKFRTPDKEFFSVGSLGKRLFGQGVSGSSKRIVITEGELDALSYAEVFRGWPVVSPLSGAGNMKSAVAANLDYLNGFEEVIIAADNDEPGQAAAEATATLFRPGKVKIARMTKYKDFSDALQAGDAKAIRDAIFSAEPYRPDGIVTAADVAEDALKPIEKGLPWCFPSLDAATYGRRFGEVTVIGAGTGIGKTDFLTQQIAFDVDKLGQKVGVFFLEQPPRETLLRVAGKAAGTVLHVPSEDMEPEVRRKAVEHIVASNKLFMYDSFGAADWEQIESRIEFLNASQNIRIFYVDHLTALADPARERESLEALMKAAAMLTVRLKIILIMVSHLATPDGKPHEEGGRVTIRHFKGSRSIGFWSFLMIGLERDQQSEDLDDRRTTTVRILKDRYTGRGTGRTFEVMYDNTSGLMAEPYGVTSDAESDF